MDKGRCLGGGRFVSTGERIRLPDDVTMGYIIEHLLKQPLTVVDQFHSHLEPMKFIRRDMIEDQISFSYARSKDEWNVVKIEGFDEEQDQNRQVTLFAMDHTLTSLKATLPCRDTQIEQLYNLFAYKDEPFVESVYIYGGPSTGKSIVVTTLLEKLEIKHAVVNLIECYTSKILFESILNKFSGHKIDPRNPSPYAKCDNLMDFIFNLQKLSEVEDLENSILVLDKAEELRNMDFNLLAGFLRLKELSAISISKNFVKYCQPIINKEHTINDSTALWRNIAPSLKSSLEVLYLRVDSVHSQKTLTTPKENLAQSLELPFYAKYLLIAAYLASYNSVKDDKRLFMKYHGKKTKTKKDVNVKNKVSERLNTQLGPKPFTLDRLLAIFYSVVDDKVGFNNNLLVQVSSLVELQLLSTVSDNCCLDGLKYKCNVNFDFIHGISRMVGFNIRKYLSDFSHF
ncbi:hypothetical protein NQ315_014323 [Exocentrus adspersus]|uniref:Origin recognition complex subunit 5 n=1 Tax=Exocentrus adspersus TaxID=1586481 RepID=A0AAV8VLI3_9CUCU|nr:hypothetical protein NQ315_014323 [Exocentrus adspersus]